MTGRVIHQFGVDLYHRTRSRPVIACQSQGNEMGIRLVERIVEVVEPRRDRAVIDNRRER